MGVASYAVVWRENGEPHSGRLELGSSELRLLGSGARSRFARLRIPYREVVGVRVGRSPAERLNGAASVILERRSGVPLTIGALNGVGIIFELAEVVRNLAVRNNEKGLSTGEKQMFVKAKKILASELMYAKDMDEEEAAAWLDDVLSRAGQPKAKSRAKPKAATASA